MAEPNLFWPIFTAVLSALLLAGSFFASLAAINKRETDGQQHTIPFHWWVGLVLPTLFLIGGMLVVFDRI